MLCNSTLSLCGHLNASCFFCVFECLVCWVTSVGFQQACHSDCLSWGRDLCESCFSSSLLGPSADGDPHPRWPTHQNKRDRGSWFSDKHHSLSLLSEGQGAWRFISRGSPPLSPSTSPPPHPTGAAKSKCQSRRRRCIPSRGQLVVATEGSVACLKLLKKNLLLFKISQSSYRFISVAQKKTTLGVFFPLF